MCWGCSFGTRELSNSLYFVPFMSDEEFRENAKAFLRQNAAPANIVQAGERLLLSVLGAKSVTSLDRSLVSVLE